MYLKWIHQIECHEMKYAYHTLHKLFCTEHRIVRRTQLANICLLVYALLEDDKKDENCKLEYIMTTKYLKILAHFKTEVDRHLLESGDNLGIDFAEYTLNILKNELFNNSNKFDSG